MILTLEIILSGLSYERKDITFCEKNLKFTKNNTFKAMDQPDHVTKFL